MFLFFVFSLDLFLLGWICKWVAYCCILALAAVFMQFFICLFVLHAFAYHSFNMLQLPKNILVCEKWHIHGPWWLNILESAPVSNCSTGIGKAPSAHQWVRDLGLRNVRWIFCGQAVNLVCTLDHMSPKRWRLTSVTRLKQVPVSACQFSNAFRCFESQVW